MSAFSKIVSQKQGKIHTVSVRFSQEEIEGLQARVNDYGGSLSSYLRRVALKQNISQIPSEEIVSLLGENSFIVVDLQKALKSIKEGAAEDNGLMQDIDHALSLIHNLKDNFKLLIQSLR